MKRVSELMQHSRGSPVSGRMASGSIAGTVSVARMWNGEKTPFTAEGGVFR